MAGEYDEMTPTDPYFWPVWRFDAGRAALSRYVAPRALPREPALVASLSKEEEETLSPRRRDELLFERLYERFLAKGIRYGREPWASREGVQQIRHPWWLFNDRHGTCVDLAATFAGMCLDARLRTVLVLTKKHALVAIGPGESTDGAPLPELEHPGFSPVEPGVEEGPADALEPILASGQLVVVDVVEATDGAGYGQARDAARIRLGDEGRAGNPVWLIDVAAVQGHDGYDQLDPPAASRPAIRMRVPAGDSVAQFFPNQHELIGELQGTEGIVALVADSGRGKSVLARHLAENAKFGAAWFLDASDRKALLNSLAMAMQVEMGRPEREATEIERKSLAETALVKLRTAAGPWLVVFDNADGDPNEIRDLLPAPKPGQQLLITTTNEEWGAFFERESFLQSKAIPLPPVNTAAVRGFGGERIVNLVDGRALLIDAFRKLDPEADWATVDLPAPPADLPAELRGPAVYWDLLRSRSDFGRAELEVAALAAFLPPNGQPVAAFAELVEGGEAALELLHELGLVSIDRNLGLVRLHRLFGGAVRADLEANESELCDRLVRALTADPRSKDALDEYGDLDTVKRLDERLTAIAERTDGVDHSLGVSLHGVGMLLELHGHTRRSGLVFELAEPHLMDDVDRRADCLLGRARTVNQHEKKKQKKLEEAIGWSQEARKLKLAARKVGPAYRALAMEGLLMRPLADFRPSGEPRRQLLDEAQEIIEEADDVRQALPDDEVPPAEKARSRYNLAGVRIKKAKEAPARAAEHLAIARGIYEEVAARRGEIYGRMVHPHIAACINGLAIVDYHRAILLPADPSQRTAWLRDATGNAIEALKQRELLDGSADGEEAGKSAELLAKIALARTASPDEKTLEDAASTADQAIEELRGSDRLPPPVPSLPASPRGLREAIGDWAPSPALLEVVGAFGQLPPKDLELPELLAWLDRFSDRWDFRKGERDIGTSPQFTEATRQIVEAGASALGMAARNTEPSGEFDLVLVLGGLARAAISRPAFAARAISKGDLRAGRVVAIGAFRDLSTGERELLAEFEETAARDEFDAMEFGVRRAFELGSPDSTAPEDPQRGNAYWRVHRYATAAGMQVDVVAAPSSEPDARRANTADTLAWLARTQVDMERVRRLLIVTTDIYAPYQHADALRTLALPYGVEVEVVGVVPGLVDRRLAHEFTTDKYLGEIRSTIRALQRLEQELAAADSA
jgi:hypothetical protein